MTYKKPIIVGIVAVLLDYLFHKNFTYPMETTLYFIIKFIVVYYLAYLMFENKINIFNLRGNLFYAYYGVIFAVIFGIYYRAVEFVSSSAYLSRVPDITFGNITSATPLQAGIVWMFFHGAFYFIGVITANKLSNS